MYLVDNTTFSTAAMMKPAHACILKMTMAIWRVKDKRCLCNFASVRHYSGFEIRQDVTVLCDMKCRLSALFALTAKKLLPRHFCQSTRF